MIQDTSTRAFDEVRPNLGQKQAAVRRLLMNYPHGLTNVEIAKALGWPINTVTPRCLELRKLGAVVPAGKRECHFTGRLAHTWKLKPLEIPKVAPTQTPQQQLTWSTQSN